MMSFFGWAYAAGSLAIYLVTATRGERGWFG